MNSTALAIAFVLFCAITTVVVVYKPRIERKLGIIWGVFRAPQATACLVLFRIGGLWPGCVAFEAAILGRTFYAGRV